MKMILDAMMIQQLCDKQDVEDRKQIGLFGLKANSEIAHGGSTQEGCDDQVLKVDRNCVQCSGNMSQAIHQIKLACLSYTS